MRLMMRFTFLWIMAITFAAIASHALSALPAGDRYVDLAVAILAVDFTCWWVGVVGAPIVLIGWAVVAIVDLTRRDKPAAAPELFIRTEDGLYIRDADTGNYHKAGPPC